LLKACENHSGLFPEPSKREPKRHHLYLDEPFQKQKTTWNSCRAREQLHHFNSYLSGTVTARGLAQVCNTAKEIRGHFGKEGKYLRGTPVSCKVFIAYLKMIPQETAYSFKG